MKVQFATSTVDLPSHLDDYAAIREEIIVLGHTLARDWLAGYILRPNAPVSFDKKAWQKINKETIEALVSADAVIIDLSNRSFSIGFQAAKVISLQKPLLLIANEQSKLDNIMFEPKGSVIQLSAYSSRAEARKIVREFLRKNDATPSDFRFNMFLDPEIFNYVRWRSALTGQSKAAVIRKIIKEKIDSENS